MAIKSRSHPPNLPFILDSEAELQPSISFTMKIQTAILSDHLTFGSFHLLRLVMQLISFSKRVTHGHTTEATKGPEIFRELRHRIGRQLVQLCLEG
jgi:hypothetical protein